MSAASKFKVGDVVRIYGEWSHYKQFLDQVGGPMGPKTKMTVSRIEERKENGPVVWVTWFVKDRVYDTCFSPCFLEKVKEGK